MLQPRPICAATTIALHSDHQRSFFLATRSQASSGPVNHPPCTHQLSRYSTSTIHSSSLQPTPSFSFQSSQIAHLGPDLTHHAKEISAGAELELLLIFTRLPIGRAANASPPCSANVCPVQTFDDVVHHQLPQSHQSPCAVLGLGHRPLM